MQGIDMIKAVLIVLFFYSISITLITHYIPDDAKDYVTSFSDLSHDIEIENVTADVQATLEQQTNIPIIELGALIYYSGNILLDLMLNFIFAIPEMAGLLLSGILMIFNIDSDIVAPIQIFMAGAMIVTYILSLIQMLLNVRSQSKVL